MTSAKIPLGLTTGKMAAVTIKVMPPRIGPRLPVRVYLKEWREYHGLTQQQLGDPTISGESADPDHDGLSNLFEYATNLNPTQFSGDNRPVPGFDSNYYWLIYTKVLAATDLTYGIEQVTNLAQQWSSVTPLNEILSDDGVTQTIKAKVPRSNAVNGKLFLRLRLSH